MPQQNLCLMLLNHRLNRNVEVDRIFRPTKHSATWLDFGAILTTMAGTDFH